LSGEQIYRVDADGTGLKDLSRSVCAGFSDQVPRWSPDGSKIAFYRCCIDSGDQVFVMNADGTGQTQLTHGGSNSGPMAWSPTGAQIAFVRSRSIWIMNADGSDLTEVPNTSEVNYLAIAWSPDGSRIAFAAANP
jgi:TolB protein